VKQVITVLSIALLMGVGVAVIARGNQGEAIGWAAILVVAIIVLIVSSRHRQISRTILLAFVVRLVAVLANEYVTAVPLMGGDANRFHRTASDWALQGGPTLSRLLQTSGSRFYVALISTAYAQIGISRMLMEMLNVLVGCFIVLEVYKLTVDLWNVAAARRAALVAALFPTLILYSAALLREAFFALPFIIGLRYLARWTKSKRFTDLVVSFIALAVAASFHPAAIPALGIVTMMAVVDVGEARTRSARARLALRWIAAAIIASASMGGLIASGWGTEKLNTEEGLSVDVITNSQEAASRDRAGYLRNFQSSSPVLVIVQAPIRIAYFLFTPFPWQVTEAADLVGLVDGLLYLTMVIIYFRRRRMLMDNKAARAVLLAVTGSIFVLGLFTSNYGTALRHRAKTAPVLICLAAVTLLSRNTTPRRRVPGRDPLGFPAGRAVTRT
jgi:4-amino-4-deoxy-L-arabinose transferase-like glycosyltransferase